MKLGLKLWSDNNHYIKHASDLYKEGYFDYIELYCVPGTYGAYMDMWKDLNIPYIIHAAHSLHGFNLADDSKKAINLKLFDESRMFADALNALYIIVHPGVLGSHNTVKEQLKLLQDERILIENKPYLALNNKGICAGNDPKEIRDYMFSSGFGFCLDINHAFNFARHKKEDIVKIMEDFFEIGPKLVHMSGIDIRTEMDNHLHLPGSMMDISWVIKAVSDRGVGYSTLETPKDSKEDLDDFKSDVLFVKKILKTAGKTTNA